MEPGLKNGGKRKPVDNWAFFKMIGKLSKINSNGHKTGLFEIFNSLNREKGLQFVRRGFYTKRSL